MELVVVTTSQERSVLLNDFKAPALSIVVGGVDGHHVLTVDIYGADSSVVVTHENFAIQVVD